MPRLGGLDSLRGLAVLVVVLFHARVFPWGHAGVDLFFVLSGFLITTILLEARPHAATLGDLLRPFYARRALRILPLAWLTCLLVAVWTGQWRGALAYGSYLSNWIPTPYRVPPPQLAHFWSLAVEEQFYLVWPLLVFRLRPAQLTRVCGALLVVAVGARLVFPLVTHSENVLGNNTLVRLDPIVIGAWLAVRRDEGRLPQVSTPVVLALLAAFFAWDLPVLLTGVRPDAIYVTQSLVTGLASGALVCWALARGQEARPLARLGTISYGVYVVHGLVAPWLVDAIAQRGLRAALLLGVSVVVAEASWRLFERPVLRWKDRWPMPDARRRAVARPDVAVA